MTTTPEKPGDVEDMLRVVDGRIRAIETMSQRSLGALAVARERLGRFQLEPVGGRLLWLKRIAFWFTASAFDRQCKVQASVLDAMDEVVRELVDLRNGLAVLRADVGLPAPAARHGGEPRAIGRDGADPEPALLPASGVAPRASRSR